MNTYFTQKNKSEAIYENQDVFDELIESNRKMTDVEKFYTQDWDQGETLHITKYIIKNSMDVKTLDVKILELRDDPDNIQLLLDVISIIYEQGQELIEAG